MFAVELLDDRISNVSFLSHAKPTHLKPPFLGNIALYCLLIALFSLTVHRPPTIFSLPRAFRSPLPAQNPFDSLTTNTHYF